MTRIARRVLLAIALLPAALAIAAPADDTRRTDELMRKSGLWMQVGQILPQVQAGAAQAREEAKSKGEAPLMEDADYARLRGAMAGAYSPERLRKAVAAQMRTELSAKDEEEVLVWLSSTLGARITKIEEESGEPEAMTKAEREIPGHFASVPAARIEKFERFGKVIHAGESTVTALINTTTAIVYGAALATPPYDAAPAIILRERMESQRAQMVATFTQQAVEQFAYIYRGLSDEELGRYLAFAESPAGRRYHDATVKVLEDVLTHAALDMGRELARTAPSQPSRRS